MPTFDADATGEMELANVTVTAGDRTFDLGKPGTPEFDAARLEFIRYQAAREGSGLREPTHTREDYEETSADFTRWNALTLRAKAAYEAAPTPENLDALNAARGRMAEAKRDMDEAYHGHHGTTPPSDGLI